MLQSHEVVFAALIQGLLFIRRYYIIRRADNVGHVTDFFRVVPDAFKFGYFCQFNFSG
jgi:hypothetical protein